MKFISRLLIYSVVLMGAYFLVRGAIPAEFRFEGTGYLVLFYILMMMLFNWWLFRPLARGRSVVTRYLGATTGKFMICLAVMAVYVFTHRDQAVPFTVHFLAFYFLYTIFEVAFLYRLFRKGAVT